MSKNVNQNATSLTCGEAISIIDDFSLGYIVKRPDTAGGNKTLLTFDIVKIEDGLLVFRQLNATDMVAFPVENIVTFSTGSKMPFRSGDTIVITLINGEQWVVGCFGQLDRHSHNHEIFPQIELDDFLERLGRCEKVWVSQSRSQIDMGSYYDFIKVVDIDEHNSPCGGTGIMLIFDDKATMGGRFYKCTINICGYNTKLYLFGEDSECCIIHIDLDDTPFTSIQLTLFYGKE